ncbi:MAG: F0F1 ATP synthase subunit delta [Nitrospirota bacterium]
MKFDLWTFLFQIVNFVVLLYILKRLLFKPIREIMEKRRKAINDALSGAEGKRQEAEKLEGARADADKAIEKERAVFEVEKRKFESDLREKAAEVVSDYAANVLKDVSDEDLHRSIVRKFRGEVEKIASDISGIEHPGEAVALKVISAFPLDGGEADEIKKAFETSLGKKVSFSFDTDAALIAGIAVRADDKVYDFSLQGQIRSLRDKLGGAGNSWKS